MQKKVKKSMKYTWELILSQKEESPKFIISSLRRLVTTTS